MLAIAGPGRKAREKSRSCFSEAAALAIAGWQCLCLPASTKCCRGCLTRSATGPARAAVRVCKPASKMLAAAVRLATTASLQQQRSIECSLGTSEACQYQEHLSFLSSTMSVCCCHIQLLSLLQIWQGSQRPASQMHHFSGLVACVSMTTTAPIQVSC